MQSLYLSGLDGISIYADSAGDPDAPPVILLHGGGQTRHSWGTAVEQLAGLGYWVIAPDLRGHGDSGWAKDGDYTLDAFAGDVREIARQCRRPPALVGASLGGVASLLALAQQAQRDEPPLASALILVDVVPRMSTEGVARIRSFMLAQPDGFANLEEASEAIAAFLPNRPRPRSTDGLRKNLRQGSDQRWRWHWDPAFHGIRNPGGPASITQRMEAAAVQVTLPTLIVRGANSELVEPQAVEQLRRLMPHAETVQVADAGHMVVGDRNDAFNAVIEQFLQQTLQPIAVPGR